MEIILEGNMNRQEMFIKYFKTEQKYMHIIIMRI